jgi:hypothetical protein
VLAFLLSLTKDNKQATKRNRYSVLASFYNFIINTALPASDRLIALNCSQMEQLQRRAYQRISSAEDGHGNLISQVRLLLLGFKNCVTSWIHQEGNGSGTKGIRDL